MPAEPLTLLGFDTSGRHCAAALLSEKSIRASRHEEMGRGQAERLLPLLTELLDEAGLGWSDLDGIVVGTGPGNFTGIRISVATARGLALGLGLPALGISTFDLMRDPTGPGAHPAELVSLPAPRDQAYLQAFRFGRPQGPARLVDPAALPADLRPAPNLRVRGHRAGTIAAALGAEADPAELSDIGPRLLHVALWRLHDTGWPAERPAPLYIRPADAAPASDPPPVILGAR